MWKLRRKFSCSMISVTSDLDLQEVSARGMCMRRSTCSHGEYMTVARADSDNSAFDNSQAPRYRHARPAARITV
jgi:hypothetical protein